MSEFVMVPRDLLEKAAGMVESYSACVAAYVKADDLERWDYVPGIDDCAEDLRAALAAAPPSPPPSSVKAREIDAFEAGYIQGHDATVEGRYADPSDAAQDYVRTLLVPVDEAAPLTESAEAPVAWMRAAGVNPQFEPAVISATVKRIWLRVKPARVERYTVPLYTHPAPTTADAGVTEAMVETFEAKFLECARTRPDSTLRDDIRAALVAALGARKGE